MKKYFNPIIEIEKFSYIDKKKAVQQICQTYQKIKNLQTKYHYKSNTHPEQMLSTFEILLNSMQPDYAMVIRKDYLENHLDNDWSQEIWSKSTYYKYSHAAVDQFLTLMYE